MFLFRLLIWQTVTDQRAKQVSSFSKMAMSFVLTTGRHLNNGPQACGGVCMIWLEKFACQLPELCRCSIYSRSKSHHDYTAQYREQWLIPFLKSIQHLRPFAAAYNNLRPLLLLVVIFPFGDVILATIERPTEQKTRHLSFSFCSCLNFGMCSIWTSPTATIWPRLWPLSQDQTQWIWPITTSLPARTKWHR